MFHSVYRGSQVEIGDYRCACGPADVASEELTARFELNFVRRGVFRVKTAGEEVLVSSAHVLLLRPGVPYRVAHPAPGGDDCTVLAFTEEAAPAFHDIHRAVFSFPRAVARPNVFLAHLRLFRRLGAERLTALEIDELGWDILLLFARELGARGERRPSRRVTSAVERAQQLIACHFAEDLPLDVIARMVGLSPFHLSRHFRQAAGMTLHRLQNTLRLREALRRLERGANDLTLLALDLGFADHSHFCGAFRREFGISPSAFRASAATTRSTMLSVPAYAQ